MQRRNGTDPHAQLPEQLGAPAPAAEAPPAMSGPVEVLQRAGAAGIALKAVLAVVAMALSAAGGLALGVRDAATELEVDQAQRTAEKYSDQLIERHAITGPHVELVQRGNDHERRLTALEREQDWQGTVLAAIADKLKVTMPPRPRRSSP